MYVSSSPQDDSDLSLEPTRLVCLQRQRLVEEPFENKQQDKSCTHDDDHDDHDDGHDDDHDDDVHDDECELRIAVAWSHP